MNTTYKDDVYKRLETLGLNKNQSNTYLSLLELGKGTVVEIARYSGVNRTTVYDNLESLRKKELITVGIEYGKRYFYAESPESLKLLLNDRIEETSQLMKQLQSIYT
jgi:sugar-specific transcriptional regulator TrmB